MGKGDWLGEFEQLNMLAILQRGNKAYGLQVRRELEENGRDASIGSVYATLDRLEKKGLVRSWEEQAPDVEGRKGRPKRFFEVTGAGRATLQASLAQLENMIAGSGLAWAGGGI